MTEDVLAIDVLRPWTLADLELTPHDGRRYELIDGSLHVTPPPGSPHALIASRPRELLRQVIGTDLEVLQGAGVQLRNSERERDLGLAGTAEARAGRPPRSAPRGR